MNHFKKQLFTTTVFVLIAGLTASCSKEGDPVNPIDPVNPVDPTEKPITLTQLSASLSDLTAVTRASNPEEAHVIKTAFVGGDFFQFTYNAPKDGGMQEAYAHTADGKVWVFRKTSDALGAVHTVNIDPNNTALKATYLPLAAKGAVDGIVLDSGNQLTCYDALTASGTAAISGESATASLNFTHVNHLLRFSISGDASAANVDHLLLTVSYKDAAGKQQTSLLKTVLHTEYTATGGAKTPVVQAILPREALLKGIAVVFTTGKLLVANDPDHSPADLSCPGGKSRLITLAVSNDQLTIQPGDISAGWTDGGTINSDEKLADAIYISSAADLKKFRDAVNTDPVNASAKINGILAYTANVVQTADIDLNGENWTPIGGAQSDDGSKRISFNGTYNGNGYTISNMKVVAPIGNGASHYGGLFGDVESSNNKRAVLVGIHLRNASVVISNVVNNYVLSAGALVGWISGSDAYPAVISLCSVTGNLNVSSPTGGIRGGGLVGTASKTHVTRCTVNVKTEATGTLTTSAGGLVGYTDSSTIASCYTQGDVAVLYSTNFTANVGGLVGYVNDVSSLIIACRTDGAVNGSGQTVRAGGLVGSGIGALLGSFAKGFVAGAASSKGYVGTIMGLSFSYDEVHLCFGRSNDEGSSNIYWRNGDIIYRQIPEAGDILKLVSASGRPSTTPGSTANKILTVVNPFASGLYTTRVESRLWSLKGLFDEPWSSTAPGGTDIFPAPVMSYAGQQF